MKRVILLFTLLFGLVYSRSVTFNVISFGKKTQVVIENTNKKYGIGCPDTQEPLFRGKLKNAPDEEIRYYYIVDGVAEEFVRTLAPGLKKTYFDFYGREHTLKTLEEFSYPDNNWKRSVGKNSLFDDSYIPTIHITGNVSKSFFIKPTSYSQRLERFTFYLKDKFKTYTNVPSTAKNKSFSKFQFKISLGENSPFENRYLLKFRNGSEDPTNLRQTIYGNMLRAVGAPAIQSIMVRVYVNKEPVGFYTLQEEAFSDSFLKAEFYGNEKEGTINAPSPLGFCYDCSTGSDFEYQPFNMSYYDPFVVKEGESLDPLLSFTKALSELDINNESAVNDFNEKWFDIDTFHKAMSLEYLTGDWDAYWHFSSNFAFYNDPTESTDSSKKFYFISQDHDETFGVGLHKPINTVGYEFPKQSYTTMLNKIWHYDEFDAFHRTLVDKFIGSTPALQKRFQDTLIKIVQNIFNPVAFGRRLNSMTERYDPEIKWDYSFKRPHTVSKETPSWNYDSFKTNLESPVPGIPWGLMEFVTLRAESIKKEFCITWEGDSNPPPSNCVPYKIPNSETTTTTTKTKTTTTKTVTKTVKTKTTKTKTITKTQKATPTRINGPTTIPSLRNRLVEWLKNNKPSRN